MSTMVFIVSLLKIELNIVFAIFPKSLNAFLRPEKSIVFNVSNIFFILDLIHFKNEKMNLRPGISKIIDFIFCSINSRTFVMRFSLTITFLNVVILSANLPTDEISPSLPFLRFL